MFPRPGLPVIVCAVTLVLAAAPGTLAAASSYGLHSPSAVDVPDRTVSVDGRFFTVTEVARLSRGEALVLEASAPAGASYEVRLYDSDRMVVAVSDPPLVGNGSLTLETGYLAPGSYVAVIRDGGDIEAVLPVVVRGYTVTVDAPETVEAGGEVTVSATLSAEPTASNESGAEIAVVQQSSGEVVLRQDMTADGPGKEYSVTVRLDEPGEYSVYVNVRGRRTVEDRRVLLGFSDPRVLLVTEPESANTTVEDGSGSASTAEAATRSPSPTEMSKTTVTPVGTVITRNATVHVSTTSEELPVDAVPTLLAVLLLLGVGERIRR